MESDDILNIKDTAKYLRIPVSTIYRLAQLGKIPAVKVGKHWRFLKKDLQLLFVQKREEHSQFPENKEKPGFC
jgi:excisionase family DNA binding protein